MNDALKPSPALLAKVGSILVHLEESSGPLGHAFDVIALRQLAADAEVQEWLDGLRKLAMVPVKRTENPAQAHVKSKKRA